jgi:tetratricopeptide (TPR) repeat protein
MELRRHLQEQYAAGYYLSKLHEFKRGLSNDNPEAADTQYAMACKYARMLYDCHFDWIRNAAGEIYLPSTNDTVFTLWIMTGKTAANLILVLCHLAGTFGPKGLELTDQSDSVVWLQKARKVAEKMISFLSDKPVCARESFLMFRTVQLPVRREKFLMSFRAHIVCKALGDVDAAIEYLEDAIKYDSESNPDNPVEKLNELKAERGTGNNGSISKVVRWQSKYALCRLAPM